MRPSSAFGRAVAWLRKHKKTVTAVESSCGGLISSGIMAVPGSSAVYFGGSVSYNTKKARKLLLDDEEMHSALVAGVEPIEGETEADTYIRSKHEWTARTAVAFCEALQTDYALAEGGAVGPTFRKEGLTTGFTVLCIAGRATPHEEVTVLAQRLVRSAHADREGNMRAFADEAAAFLCETIGAAAAEAEADAAPAVPPSGLALDRDSGARTNASKVAEHLASPFARFVLCRGGQVLLREGGGAAEGESGGKLALLSRAAAQLPEGEARDSSRLSYLGQLSGLEEAAGAEAAGAEAGGAAGGDASSTPVFAVDVPAEEAPPLSGAEYADTRLASARLRGAEAALALYAHGLLTWQRRSAFCARCGGANGLAHAGHARQCQACGALSFPRQDPAIIVTVQSADGKSLLLARSSRHPPRLHTALAGFVEVGETFEDAVARETFEETGVRIDPASVSYVASQPWPFPQSTMLGFRATAAPGEGALTVDTNELVEAGWFDQTTVAAAAAASGPTGDPRKAEVAAAIDPALPLLVPPAGVLARTLIERWLEAK